MKQVTFVVATIMFAILTAIAISAEYRYEQAVLSEWTLADRSSTIHSKREHIDKFVARLEAANLWGLHNAILFPTGANSFDTNLAALHTLQARLIEIENMDIRSFEYQVAIQQITAQEQGEADHMLAVFAGVWQLKYYFPLWDWVGVLICAGLGVTALISGLSWILPY